MTLSPLPHIKRPPCGIPPQAVSNAWIMLMLMSWLLPSVQMAKGWPLEVNPCRGSSTTSVFGCGPRLTGKLLADAITIMEAACKRLRLALTECGSHRLDYQMV